jgi:hypothetical protein
MTAAVILIPLISFLLTGFAVYREFKKDYTGKK